MIRRVLDATKVSHAIDQLNLGRWIALAVVGCVAIAAWALPPRVHQWRGGFNPESPTPSQLEQQAAVKAAVNLNAERVRNAWLQTMRTKVSGTPEDQIAFWLPEDLEPEIAQGFRTTLSSAVAGFGAAKTPVRIGFFLVDRNQGGHPALTDWDRFSSTETYLGEVDGQPFCLTGKVRSDVDVSRNQLEYAVETPSRALRELGACGFYAKYGQAGRHVVDWLAAGGYRYADFVFVDRFPRVGFTSARGAFGLNGQGVGLPKQACAAGSVEPCEMMFLEPLRYLVGQNSGSRHPPVAAFAEVGQAWFEIALLGWLEKEFGEEAFEAFWTSDLPVKDAFAAAFDVPLHAWMRDLTVRTIGPVTPGPAPRAANVSGSLLFVAFGITFSLFISRRGNARLA